MSDSMAFSSSEGMVAGVGSDWENKNEGQIEWKQDLREVWQKLKNDKKKFFKKTCYKSDT